MQWWYFRKQGFNQLFQSKDASMAYETLSGKALMQPNQLFEPL